jgi:hypothetical protein
VVSANWRGHALHCRPEPNRRHARPAGRQRFRRRSQDRLDFSACGIRFPAVRALTYVAG